MDQFKQRAILTVESLTVTRGDRRIHESLSVSFGPGITAILGPNGIGKTSLLEGILETPSKRTGTLTLDGEKIEGPAATRRFFGRVGFMPQQWQYMRSFTARESVEYAAWVKGVPSTRLSSAASFALARVGLLDDGDRKVRTLSGGMRQRVGLAETFVNDPRLVLLDEPTVGLDPAQRAEFRGFLRANATDRAIVLSTHLTDDVDALADRVIVLNDAGLAFDGSVTSLRELAEGQEGAANDTEAGYLSIVRHPSTPSETPGR